jgi:hypothetical protein
MYRNCYLLLLVAFFSIKLNAQQNPDQIFDSTIHTVIVSPIGKPLAAPIVSLYNGGILHVSFDDFKARYEDYFYSIELMDSAWQKTDLNEFNYVRGFNQIRISNYTVSSMSSQNYFHYQFDFPNSNCKPMMSGNYIFKVYKGSNKQSPIFTKRFYVVEELAFVNVSVQEPFDGAISRTHQKINVNVDVKNIPSFQNDQITIKVVQNNRYNDAKSTSTADFIRGTVLVFNNESSFVFPGGKEARWLDLQNLSLRSDRVAAIEFIDKRTHIYVKPDLSRNDLLYSRYKDLNGGFLIMNTESLISETQNDYVKVHFYYVTKQHNALLDKKIYLSGALTNNTLDKGSEMLFDAEKGVYQKTLLLKQGYYSYNYIARDRNDPNIMDDFGETEGDHTETENEYTIFVYYHTQGTLNDQLIGFATLNTSQNW